MTVSHYFHQSITPPNIWVTSRNYLTFAFRLALATCLVFAASSQLNQWLSNDGIMLTLFDLLALLAIMAGALLVAGIDSTKLGYMCVGLCSVHALAFKPEPATAGMFFMLLGLAGLFLVLASLSKYSERAPGLS